MGNLITNEKAGDDCYLKLSNGATSVLISVLVLSGSDLATSRSSIWEKQLITWLAEKDQDIFGIGVVGFDLADIAWQTENFAAQKAFLLGVIDLALTRHRWQILDYDPPHALDYLQNFRKLVERYLPEMVVPNQTWDWWAEPEGFPKCPIHDVYMHAQGCVICHDT